MTENSEFCAPPKRRRIESSSLSNGIHPLKSRTQLFMEFQQYVTKTAISEKKTKIHVSCLLIYFAVISLKDCVKELIKNSVSSLNPFAKAVSPGDKGSSDEVDCAPNRSQRNVDKNFGAPLPTLSHFPQKLLLDQVRAAVDHILPSIEGKPWRGYQLDENDNSFLFKGCLYLHYDILRRVFSRVKAVLHRWSTFHKFTFQPEIQESYDFGGGCPFLNSRRMYASYG